MKCIFMNDIIIKDDNLIVVQDNHFHHLKNVLRVKKNERLDIKDHEFSYSCSLFEINKDQLVYKIIDKRKLILDNSKVILCQSIIKLDAFELILQKSTEIGVYKIIPYLSKRSIIKLDDLKLKKKVIRWNKILEESSQQSSRDYIPELVHPIETFNELDCFPDFSPILLHENEKITNLKNAFDSSKKDIILIIGPEGGFDESELSVAANLNFQIAGLNRNVLRSETAAIFALSSYFFYNSSGHQSIS